MGNINNLSVVAPTSGYVDISNSAKPNVLLGGGNLKVKAGGDINSGVFYVGNGQGVISAGGALGLSTGNSAATVLALGSGNFNVSTGGDLTLQTVLNPTALIQGFAQKAKNSSSGYSFFFTYGDTSSITLSSQAGNVLLANDTSSFSSQFNFGQNSNFYGLDQATVYPGLLQATALGGSITDHAQTLFPSATGNLKFIASGDINLIGLQSTLSNNDPGTLQANSPVSKGDLFSNLTTGNSTIHAADVNRVIIAAGGSISGDNSSPVIADLLLPKAAKIQAGQDISNLSLFVQNQNGMDTSLTAGRDIVFTPNATNPNSATVGITVAGAGQINLQAGRNVDLGQSAGVLTIGNLENPLLTSQGAGVTVLAGVGQNTETTQAFINKYIDPSKATVYVNAGAELISYVNSYGNSPVTTPADAYTAFSAMPESLKNTFVNQVFFALLQQSGRSAASSGNYSAGYDTIATLFPTGGNQGDVSLYYSQIKTERGGDINILAPGGSVNAGLANPSSNGPTKTPAELGIVTVSGGNVDAFVNNDFLVNQSRVFTIQGGNILMWSSTGNIDAGKGSKTASSTPPPQVVVDLKTGAFTLDATQSIVGSGIRVLLGNKNVVPGTVDLYAPAGVINAGDAGIGAAGNIFLGALQVIGANNINFGGTGTGVPVATVAPVSVSGMGNVQDAGKAADQATQSLSNANDLAKLQDALANFKPTFISVDVIGLGNESMGLQQ